MGLNVMLARICFYVFAFCLVALSLNPQAWAARGDRWTQVSEVPLDTSQSSTLIDLRALSGSFMAFRMRVVGGTVKFDELKLNYSDGSFYAADQAFELRNGESTKVLDFFRRGRFINSVRLSYAVVQGTEPRVQIHGLQSWRGRRAQRPAGEQYVKSDEAPPLPTSTTQVLPQATGGLLVASKYVTFHGDHDKIKVAKEMGKFGRVRIQVRDEDVYLNSFKIVYADGTENTHKIDLHIPEGRTTDWVDIDGTRFIDHLELSYRKKPGFEGHARIEVMGEHAEGWLSETGEGGKFNDGWILLGAQSAGFVGFDTDIIPVGEHVSGFKEIRVVVRDRAITLNQLRVVYGNGDEDIIPVRTRIDAGGAFGPVDLRHAPRRIKEIQARYRSRFIDQAARGKGAAVVEVWARR